MSSEPLPAFAVSWAETSSGEEERLAAARSIVVALFGADVDAADPVRQWKTEPSDLIGIAARARYSALTALETRPDAPLSVEMLAEPRELDESDSENTAAADSARRLSLRDHREVFGVVGRPGTGGRQATRKHARETEDTRKLLERLGDPTEHRTVAGRVVAMRWLVNKDGESAWIIRLSPTSQEKAQETAMDQLHAMEKLRDEGLLSEPRWIVVTLNNSGTRLPHERYDLMLMLSWIKDGWLRTVVFRNEKRLARQKFTLAWCEQIFESTGTDIFFTEYRHCVDWNNSNDRTLFTIKGLFAAEDRRAIYEQTQSALDRLYVDEGKGWPGLEQVGLFRDPLTGFFAEDEEQTAMILRGAKLYRSKGGGQHGLKWVAKEMADKFGFELSPKQWERILKNEGFVTGEFFFNRKGRGRVALKPIQLVNAMPRQMFNEIQSVFATNKGNSRSRSGDFVLLRGGDGQKGVPASEKGIFCKRCKQKLYAWLQGDLNNTCYRHHGKVPACCRGWGGIEHAEIEAVVIPELWRLEDVRELRETAARASAAEDVRVTAHLDKAQRRQLLREIDDLEREIARLGREYRRLYLHNGKAANSRKNHIEAYHNLTAGLEQDKAHLEARIAEADALDTLERTIPPTIDTGLSQALREVLTVEVPDDDTACRRRAATYGAIVTKVIVDKKDDGSYAIEIYGPLIPRDLPVLNVPAPSEFAIRHLEEHRTAKERANGQETTPRFTDARPDLATRPDLQGSSQGAPYDERCSWRFAWRVEVAA